MARGDIDLDRFPTSETAKRMLSRVSPVYDMAYVGKWLFQIMGMELDETRMIVRSLRDQCFLDRVTWGMRYWEERYGIEVDETLDLETRRARVRRAATRYGPISPARVEEIIGEMSGLTVHVTEDNAHYSFDIQFEQSDTQPDYTAILEKLDSIKPSHLSYRIILPRDQKLTLFFGAAIHARKSMASTEWEESGADELNWLVDEDGNTLLDEDGNVLIN